PALQQFLENYLGLAPLAGLIAGSTAGEHLQARGQFARAVDQRVVRGQKLIKGNGLHLTLDAEQVEFPEDQARVASGSGGGVADQNVRAILLVEPFQAREI